MSSHNRWRASEASTACTASSQDRAYLSHSPVRTRTDTLSPTTFRIGNAKQASPPVRTRTDTQGGPALLPPLMSAAGLSPTCRHVLWCSYQYGTTWSDLWHAEIAGDIRVPGHCVYQPPDDYALYQVGAGWGNVEPIQATSCAHHAHQQDTRTQGSDRAQPHMSNAHMQAHAAPMRHLPCKLH